MEKYVMTSVNDYQPRAEHSQKLLYQLLHTFRSPNYGLR